MILLLIECFPRQLLQLFDASDNMMAMGVPAIRIMAMGFFLAVLGVAGSAVFQALGMGNYSLYLTIIRRVVLPLGLAYVFSLTGNLTLVWNAFILAEVLSAPLTIFLLHRIRKNILDKLK